MDKIDRHYLGTFLWISLLVLEWEQFIIVFIDSCIIAVYTINEVKTKVKKAKNKSRQGEKREYY